LKCARNHSAGSDNATVTYVRVFEYCYLSANEDVISNINGLRTRIHVPFIGIQEVEITVYDENIMPNMTILTN